MDEQRKVKKAESDVLQWEGLNWEGVVASLQFREANRGQGEIERKELGKCRVTEAHVKKPMMMGISCPLICIIQFWQDEIRVRFHRILGIPKIFGKTRGPFFYEIWVFHIWINKRKVLVLDFWVSRGRQTNGGWSLLYNVSAKQSMERKVREFLSFFLLFI